MNRLSVNKVSRNPEEPSVPLTYYVHVLRRRWWKAALFVAICVGGAVAWSYYSSKVYEASAVIELDQHMPSSVIGQEAGFTSLADADQYISTQMSLIQSDSVLRPVLAKHPGLPCEGGSDAARDGAARPIVLKGLRVSRPPNTYLLRVAYRLNDPKLAATVANEIAASYVESVRRKRADALTNSAAFLEKQVETVRQSVSRSGDALALAERQMSVINPEQRTTLLSTRLAQVSADLSNAKAVRIQKEAASNLARTGSVEVLESSDQGDAIRRASDRLNEAKEKLADAGSRFGPNFPDYQRAAAQVAELQQQFDGARDKARQRIDDELRQAQDRESMLQSELDHTKNGFDQVNARFSEHQQLKESAAADQKLYTDLLRKGREASINQAFEGASIRIADAALPPQLPVSPNMPVNITIALLSSLLISAIAGLSSEALDSSVRDPEQIGRMLHTEVVGIIPMVKGKSGPGGPGTGENAEESGFSESIRTLSNSLLNGEMKPSVGTLLVTSAAPREGKSTVAAWLATANAKQGLKTLLIDVDLKAPCLHKYLGIERGSGIADILRTEIEWRKAVVTIAERGGLCVLTAGSDPMPADGVRGVALMALIKEARKEYQTVILDGPPLLGFADPTQLARMVEGVLVVAKAGVTDRRALSDVLDRLDRLHAKVLGVVLNQINETMSGAHYYSTRKYRASMKERTPVGSGV